MITRLGPIGLSLTKTVRIQHQQTLTHLNKGSLIGRYVFVFKVRDQLSNTTQNDEENNIAAKVTRERPIIKDKYQKEDCASQKKRESSTNKIKIYCSKIVRCRSIQKVFVSLAPL